MKKRSAICVTVRGVVVACALLWARLAQAGTAELLGVDPGFSMIADQINSGDNTLGALLTDGIFDGATIYKFDPKQEAFSTSVYSGGTWSDPTMTLAPGEGAFVYNPSNVVMLLKFQGTVASGKTTNAIPAGLSICSSVAPRAGRLDTDLNFPVAEGDIIYRFNPNAGTYLIYAYDFGSWTAPASVAVAESFFVWKVAATNWVQNFTSP